MQGGWSERTVSRCQEFDDATIERHGGGDPLENRFFAAVGQRDQECGVDLDLLAVLVLRLLDESPHKFIEIPGDSRRLLTQASEGLSRQSQLWCPFTQPLRDLVNGEVRGYYPASRNCCTWEISKQNEIGAMPLNTWSSCGRCYSHQGTSCVEPSAPTSGSNSGAKRASRNLPRPDSTRAAERRKLP